jgi:Transposase IS200 like
MQTIKSIMARELFNLYPDIKKQLMGSEFWSDGGYIMTVGYAITVEIIKNYIETQGTVEEREAYTQMKLYEFISGERRRLACPAACCGVHRRSLTVGVHRVIYFKNFAYNREQHDKGNLQSLSCDQDRFLKRSKIHRDSGESFGDHIIKNYVNVWDCMEREYYPKLTLWSSINSEAATPCVLQISLRGTP